MTIVLEPLVDEQEPPTKVRPYQLLAGLQFLDVATTWFILIHWTERVEGNPIAAALLGWVGIDLGCLILLAFKLGLVYAVYRKQLGVKLVSALYTAVVLNNLLFLYLWLVA